MPKFDVTFFTPSVSAEELQHIKHHQARDTYLLAYRIAFPFDRLLNQRPMEGLERLVSMETGFGFLRLAAKDPETLNSDQALLNAATEIKANLAELAQLPLRAMTPIVFALSPKKGIEELLAPETVVDFDLRGYGPRERWPWVKAETAILVWDPNHTGSITSARQLFGNYTFEIFRENGYQALAALDDNRDGFLRNQELSGIRAWFDTDSDGQSNSSEVKDLDQLGVVALDVQASAFEGVHPMNPHGLLLKDKRSLPTWDWIVEPIPSK